MKYSERQIGRPRISKRYRDYTFDASTGFYTLVWITNQLVGLAAIDN